MIITSSDPPHLILRTRGAPLSIEPESVPGGPACVPATRANPGHGAPTRGVWVSPELVVTLDGQLHQGDDLEGWEVWLHDLYGAGMPWLRRRVEDEMVDAFGGADEEPRVPQWLASHLGVPRHRWHQVRLVEHLTDHQVVQLSRYITWSRRVAELAGLDLTLREYDPPRPRGGWGARPLPGPPCPG